MELGGPSAMTLGTTLTPEQPAGTYSSVTMVLHGMAEVECII